MNYSSRKFLVRYLGSAVSFSRAEGVHKIVEVGDNHASLFESQWLAELKAAEFGLRHGTFSIESIEVELSESTSRK